MSDDEAAVVREEDELPGDEPERGGDEVSGGRRWGTRFRRVAALLILGVGVVAAAMIWTPPGQRAALDLALDQIQGVFAGDLTIQEIRSSSLLGGFTLDGVRLDTGDGRPFLSVDSLQLQYSLRGLLSGEPSLSGVTAWGLHVEISQYAPEQELNVARLLAPSPPRADSTAGPTRVVELGQVRVEGGLLEVLTPLENPTEARPGIPSPSGEGRLSRLALEELEAEVDRAVLRLGGTEPFAGFLARFSSDIHVLERPIPLRGAQGELTYNAGGIQLDDAFLRLPGSVLSGALTVGPRVTGGDGWGFGTELQTEEPGDLADLRWLDPRIPDGSFTGSAAVTTGETVDVTLQDLLLDLEASEIRLDGGFTLAEEARFQDLRVDLSPLVLARLEPWLDRELPMEGFVTGNATLGGPLTALRTSGRMTLVPEAISGGPTIAELQGTLHLGDDLGVTNGNLRLDPLNFALLDLVRPGTAPPGVGQADIQASGRLASGLRVVAEVRQGLDSAGSRVRTQGTVARAEAVEAGPERWRLDLLTDIDPLSLALLDRLVPDLELSGAVAGTVRTVGPTDTLRVVGELRVAEGTVSLDGRVNLARPDSLYRLDAELTEVGLSGLTRRLPEPSLWTGSVLLEGSGFTPDSAATLMEVRALGSRVGGLHIDSLEATIRTAAGLLTVDTAVASLGGVRIGGAGQLGLVAEQVGEARLTVHAASLAGLRPILLGDTVIARDTLTIMEADLLRLQGVDPQTLPDSSEVVLRGALDGTVRLQGSLESLTADAEAVLLDAAYGENRVDSLFLDLRAEGLPRWDGTIDGVVRARGIQVEERSFQAVDATVAMTERQGDAAVHIVREPEEELDLEGAFALDSLGLGTVDLQQGRLRLDSLVWETAGASSIRWDRDRVEVEDLRVRRSGQEPMELAAEGVLSWADTSDFHLRIDGVRMAPLVRLLEIEDLDLGGAVYAELAVLGPARTPEIDAQLRWLDADYQEVAADSVTGSLRYRSRSAAVDLAAWRQGERTFQAVGDVPVDLALDDAVEDRIVARDMDVRVTADSLRAANVLSFLSFLEEVEGAVSGDFTIAGTLDAPEPSGVFRLTAAAWTLEALGVRHAGVTGSLTLRPDRTVQVELDAGSPGLSSIRGTVDARVLTNPSLDLEIGFTNFQAVSRADIEGRVSGDLTLTGTYDRPLVEGAMTVDQGTLFLEEFARSSDVVDLSDPRVFQVVDTTALSTRPILAGVRNPFLNNLRVDIDLSVPRAVWLRSADMNVEMGGDLLVTYDRTNRDLVMVGELEALRGSYLVLGRTFNVEGGTVGFIGTPGINPTLDIEAVARIRPVEGDPIDVTAAVDGTLTQPRVRLDSDEPGLAESDLVSYLIFGRPTLEFASNTSGLEAGLLSGGVSYISGTLATRLGSVFAQEFGLDYLNITQAADLTAGQDFFRGTRVEVGRYVSDNVFIVLVFQPPTEQGSDNVFGGARVEWSLNDPYTVEGFIEDRFLRSGVGGFRDLGFESQRVLGVFIFREWGY